MKKIILILILFSFPLKAEIISATGKHKHLGDKTKIQSCRIAEEKAMSRFRSPFLNTTTLSQYIIDRINEED